MKNTKSIIFGAVITLISTMLGYYIFLPAINIQDKFLYIFIIWQLCIYCVSWNLGNRLFSPSNKKKKNEYKEFDWNWKIFIIPLVVFVFYLIGIIASSKVANASSYASILKVNEEANFNEDIALAVKTDAIALMDTDSARMLGDREIGSLANVVSQYDVSDYYTQIDFNGKPIKVSALEYAGFFKWMNNNNIGTPGYVTVNPVSMSADYCECKGMIYVPSAYFGQDLYRYVRSHYPTAILDELNFEIDEEGNPYYILPVYKMTIGLFGGCTVKGAIICDPCTGDLTYYDVTDIPRWVDVVYVGDLLCSQYNWYGTLKNGFLNSLFSKKECKRVTEYRSTDKEGESTDFVPANDYGYIAKDGDIWIYTGVTSVNKDSSNIGFLLANERTGEARYYAITGADEASAMSAAEGEVQEKEYQASFPSLINVDGIPTYIMVLKDNSGLVKLYAAVNVEQYNIVATAGTQEECIEKYKNLLGTNIPETDVESDIELLEKNITIADLQLINKKGDTYLYIVTSEQEIYHTGAIAYDGNEKSLLLKVGDVVTIQYHDKIVESWSN